MSNNMEDMRKKLELANSKSVHPHLIDQPQRRRRERKPKFEDTHTRCTLWIQDDLNKKLNEWSEEGGRGEKTRIINEALEDYFRRNS